MIANILRCSGMVTALLTSAIALIAQIVSTHRAEDRIETRELVVRAGKGSPAIEATAIDGAILLQFVDPATGSSPISLGYTAPTDSGAVSAGPPTQLAVRVVDGWAGIVASSGSARATMSAESAIMGAQVSLSDEHGVAQLAASPLVRGLKAWSRDPEMGTSVELSANPDYAQLRLDGRDSHIQARADTEGPARLRLSAGSPASEIDFLTTSESTSFEMRDRGGRTPVHLSTGEDGTIRLVPGPKGTFVLGRPDGTLLKTSRGNELVPLD